MNHTHYLFPRTILFTCILFTTSALQAQLLQVTDANSLPFTPQNLISNVFLGSGVDVSNITFGGAASAVGYFSGGTQAIGIERGIVLTTGFVESDPPNLVYGCDQNGTRFADNQNGSTASDASLSALTTGGLKDVAIYTITFVPTSDTLRFRYCFGSEEYPEYACSSFNDIFGFFIQGPGYPVPTNIAVIPGTNLPVSINNLHPDNSGPFSSCPPTNAQFYHNNLNGNVQPTYDGFTDVFTAMAVVTPCQQYTIKLAIADVGDDRYDSGVFLEAKSFGTGSLRVALETASADGAIVEGCAEGKITFRLPSAQAQDYPIDYHIWGTATNGIDYQTIPSNLVIPAGQTELIVPIVGFEDHTAETNEFLAIDVKRDPCHRDTIYVLIKDNQLVTPMVRPDTSICIGASAIPLDGTSAVVIPPPPSFTNTQDYNIPLYAPPLFTTILSSPINVGGVQPAILGAGVIKSVCVNIDHKWIDDIDMFLVSPGGQFIELSTDNGGNGDNYTNTCFTPTATTKINFPGPVAPASAAPFTGDWLPEGPWSDLYGGPTNGVWNLQVRDDKPGISGILKDWTITFESIYKIDYSWTPVTGLSCPTCALTDANPTQTTLYTVVAKDSYGCLVKDSVNIEVLPEISAPTVTCAGAMPGSVSFAWNDVPFATGGYEVNVNGTGWVPASGQLLHDVSGLGSNAPVTLEVRALNAAYTCKALVGTATCCQLPGVTANVQAVSCVGQSNGSITLIPDGANPPYTFNLGAQTNSTGIFTNLPAGDVQVKVTDVSGCSVTDTFTIPNPPAFTTNVQIHNVSCFGGDDGKLEVTVGGGTPGAAGYTYLWNDPLAQKTAIASNLKIGTYTLTITDGNGCTTTTSNTITQPADLALNAVSALAKCFNSATGSATASGTGGVQPYQFAWSNGVNGATNPNILPGNYTVTITDTNGCAETGFVTVGQPPALTATVAGQSVSCFNGNDGTATVTPAGGTGAYTYKWSTVPAQTTQTATGLQAINYLVTVTDANGCFAVQGLTVGSPTAVTATASSTSVGCNNGSDGTATVISSGGTGPYTFKWNDPLAQTTATASNLAAGAYIVTVTDAKLCTSTQTVSVGEPEALQLSAVVQDPLCKNGANGKITLSVTGGTTPYGYKWSSGETTANINNKPSGVYTVTLTDAKGCTATLTKTIGEPTGMTVGAQNQAVRCFGEATGSLKVNASGGTPAYQTQWEGPDGFLATGNLIDGLFSGDYTATVTDSKGCTATLTQTITQPLLPLDISVPDYSDTICFGVSNGVASVLAFGGTPPYSYRWTGNGPPQFTATAVGLGPAVYSLQVTDANGCSQNVQTIVKQRDQLFAIAVASNPRCYEGSDGTARLGSVFYGATPADPASFNYVWSTSPGQMTPIATGLKSSESYSVTITDDIGCSATASVTLGNTTPVQAQVLGFESVKCHGDANGWAAAAGQGGTAPYTYLWSPGASVQTDSLAQGLKAGTYKVTVMDSKGCPDIKSVTITEPPAIQTDILTTPVKCYGGKDGALTATVMGGTEPYQFKWSSGGQLPSATNLAAGPDTLTLTDANACQYVVITRVPQPNDSLTGTATHEDPICFGGRDGRITMIGKGGTPPYRYALNNQPWSGAGIQIALGAGTYIPHVIDGNGCTAILDTVLIPQPDKLEVDLGPDFTLEIGRDTQLTAIVLNGLEPYSYAWRLADSVWLSCVTCPDPIVKQLFNQHWFELNVVDDNGCEASDRILISVEKPRRIYVPTGFSPNGDNENDRLVVHGQKTAKVLTFRVFDRWGELLYEASNFATNDVSSGWDGRFRGKDMDPGVVVWVVEAEYLDGTREVFKGDSMLVR
ncbi:MAG: choice-of-anchor L domain-containing protein [Bacteroidota bacterium]